MRFFVIDKEKDQMIQKINQKWDEILDYMKSEFDISDVSYATWLMPLKLSHCDNNNLFIIASDDITLDIVTKKYQKFFKVAIAEVTGCNLDPVFVLEKDIVIPQENNIQNKATTDDGVDLSLIKKANLNPKYTFDTFVVGPNNNLAHAASLAVAESPGQAYKILYIYGGVGLGKTHLMHAIAHYILKNDPTSNILYVTSETFTNDYVESIRNKKGDYNTSDFRSKYRDLDVLLIDDIQFIVGKESTQEEFFHTFNALNERNKQIIISSDKPPKAIDNLEERLRSRFEWGLMVDIQPPNFETRMAILRKKEDMEGYNIDDEVIKYIATNIKSNIRELEGALTRIVAKARLEKTEINVDMARKILEDLIGSDGNSNELTPERIISVVAEHFNIEAKDIISTKKTKEIAYPRQIAMYLCCNMTTLPLQQIGKAMGGRDHSTIIYGKEKITKDMEKDDKLYSTIEILTKKLSP